MPRDLVRLLFDERVKARQELLHGELVSRVTQVVFGTNAVPMPCADVLLSNTILSAVPVSDHNHELLYAEAGMPVDLRRSPTGRLEIIGVSKRGRGHVHTFLVTVSTGVITTGRVYGYGVRTVTLGDLALATVVGFGATPLEALALYDAYGQFQNLLPGGGGGVTASAFVPVPPPLPGPTSTGTSAVTSGGGFSGVTSGLVSNPVSAIPPGNETRYTVTNLNNAGPGSFREAWDHARVTGSPSRIVFAVAGTIRLTSVLEDNAGAYTVIDGTAAPGPITFDCSAIPEVFNPDQTNEPSILDYLGHGHTIRGLRCLNPPYSFLRFSRADAYDNLVEDVLVINTDGRGVDGGAFSQGKGARVVYRRCEVTGTSRLRGIIVGGGATDTGGACWLISCVFSSLVGGIRTAGSGGVTTVHNTVVRDCSDYLVYADRNVVMSVTSSVFMGETGGSQGVRVHQATLRLYRSTLTGISGGTHHALWAHSTAAVLVQSSVIRLATGYGVLAENTALVDLGGGPLRSSGGNTIQGNTTLDVQNNSTRIIQAQFNTWDHATATLVSANDVSSRVVVEPLA